MNYIEVESQEDLIQVIKDTEIITYKAFQNLDFSNLDGLVKKRTFKKCLFLGCKLPKKVKAKIKNSLIFPSIDVPFNSFINCLYTKETLFNNYELGNPASYENTLDKIVYNHYIKNGKEATDIKETLARRLHDHSITDALYDFLNDYDEKKIVAIMGGHNLSRNEDGFYEIAKISKTLTEQGYLMISGGGPGAMEATHLGAWFADKEEADLKKAVEILAEAPVYTSEYWVDKAFEVLSKYPASNYKSLGIPTWLYGHEPPTPFATHIAKYFANSVREDGLLAIAKGGVIYTPGSAGTIQEIFQDATQNHYLSFGFASPMVFFNSNYWNKETPVYPLLKSLADEGKYQNMILSLCDTSEEVVDEIKKFTE